MIKKKILKIYPLPKKYKLKYILKMKVSEVREKSEIQMFYRN